MKSKSVDQKINEKDNNSNFNFVTIAHWEKETIANKYSNINNSKKNRNTNNNGNNNYNVRFLNIDKRDNGRISNNNNDNSNKVYL